jgi:ligand-binding sensor domain-containing protein
MKRSLFFLAFITQSMLAQNCWTTLTSSNTSLPPGNMYQMELVDGDLWITSDFGVVNWDGSRINTLKPNQIPIPQAKTGTIKNLSEGLFIGTDQGLTQRMSNNGNWHFYAQSFVDIISDSITAVEQDSNEFLFIGTRQGLSVLEGINWFNFTTANSDIPSNHVTAIALSDTAYWIGTKNGLAAFNYATNTWTVFTSANTSNNLGSNHINDIYIDANGTLYIATEQGLTKYNGTTWTKYTQASTSLGLGSDQINAITEDASGNLLIATDYGFSTVSKSTMSGWALYYSFNSPTMGPNMTNIFRDVYFCVDRNLTALCGNDGLMIWNGTTFSRFYSANTGLTSTNLKNLARTPDGGVWMSMSGGGVFQSGVNGQLLLTAANSGMPANSIQDMSVGLDGAVAVATSSGVGRYANGSWTNYTTAGAVLPSNLAYVVEAGINKSLYVGYATVGGRGFIVIDSNGTSTTYKTTTSAIANNNVLDIKQLTNGTVAILTSAGMSIFDGTTFTNYTTPALPSTSVKSVTQDTAGNIWIGIQNTGLVKFDGTTFTTIAAPTSSNVKKTQFGDGKVTLVDGNVVHSYDIAASNWTSYSTAAGTAPLGTSTVVDAVWSNGSLWIATNNGAHVALGQSSLSTHAVLLGRASGCGSDTIQLKAPLGFTSYTWNTGDTTQFVDTDSTQAFWFNAIDANGCTYNSDTLNVTINALPNIQFTLSNSLEFCLGDSLTVDAGAGYQNYFWNNGVQTQTQTISDQDTSLYLQVRDVNGCYNWSDTLNITVWKPFEEEEICLVTVDSLGQNQIVWNKTNGVRTLEYRVHKQNPVTNTFDNIGTVPATGQLSVFSDQNSNSRVTSSRYKISVVDSCGNESELSDQHKTMHLTLNEGISGEINLIWDGYEGIDFSQYEIYRGSSPRAMLKLADVSSANFTYTDLAPPPGLLFYKVVIVNPDPCTPTGKTNAFGESESNLVEYAATDNLIIYPNPFKENTRVVFKNPDLEEYRYRIFDATGTLVRLGAPFNDTYVDINRENLAPGLYMIEVYNDEKSLKDNFIVY